MVKKLLWIIPMVLIIGAIAFWIGWMLMDAANGGLNKEPKQTSSSTDDDILKEVVNDPVPESIIVFTSDDVPFRSGHHFIADLHEFYNNTLCWGRLETADYSRQVEKARLILEVLEHTETEDKNMKRDLDAIKTLAETVTQQDDRRAMRDLHRYFHDLDIYFNGYAYHQTFGITSFRGL